MDSKDKPILVLHMDINKTILISDKGAGTTTEQMINSILSESAWGIVLEATSNNNNNNDDNMSASTSLDDERDNGDRETKELLKQHHIHWKLVSSKPSSIPPTEFDLVDAAIVAKHRLITFGDFMDEFQISSHSTLTSRQLRKKLKGSFTEHACLGAAMRPWFQQLQHHLTASVDNSTSTATTTATTATTAATATDTRTYHVILPSFFRLIVQLLTKQIDFRIVFRTFGEDAARVVQEFNRFCNHGTIDTTTTTTAAAPLLLLSEEVKEALRKRVVKLPQQSMVLQRTSLQSNGVNLAYVQDDQTLTMARGVEDVWKTLTRFWSGNNNNNNSNDNSNNNQQVVYTMAIRDDFYFWEEHQESDNSGKLLLVQQQQQQQQQSPDATTTKRRRTSKTQDLQQQQQPRQWEQQYIQIFFDDNIERNRSHIVDVRDHSTFKHLPFDNNNNNNNDKKSNSKGKNSNSNNNSSNMYLHRVEPVLAITEIDYFVEAVQQLLQQHHSQHHFQLID